VILAFGVSTFAQTNTASATATATIVTPITLAKDVDMNFGRVAVGAAGTVQLTTAGARIAGGGCTLQGGGTIAAAQFTVSGGALSTYAIVLPASVSLVSGGNNFLVDNFTSNPSGTGALSAGGSQVILVGATMNPGAAQPNGIYSASFNVTVNYN
jgi:hypothetical protein